MRTGLLAFILSAAVIATGAQEVESENRIVAEVRGVVCSFCVYGAEKGLSGLPFLDSSVFGDGVLVEIDKGLITLASLPGKDIDLKAIDTAISDAGYDLVSIRMKLSGRLMKRERDTVLIAAGSAQVYRLLDQDRRPWDPPGGAEGPATLQVIATKKLIRGADQDIEVMVDMPQPDPRDKITMTVKGMHCKNCARRINKLLKKTRGVRSFRVDPKRGTVEVSIDPDLITENDVAATIREAGFDPVVKKK